MSYFNILYLQKKHFQHRVQFHTENIQSFIINEKKCKFFNFWVKIEDDMMSSTSNVCKEFSKISSPKLVKRSHIKSYQRWALNLYLARNNRSKTGSGDGHYPSLPFLELTLIWLMSGTLARFGGGHHLWKML